DPSSGGPAAGPAAPDVVADISSRALGRDCGCGFLHDRSLDLAGSRDVLHGVRDRIGVSPRADSRIHATSGGAVHAADGPNANHGRDECERAATGLDLRSGSEMEPRDTTSA